MMVNDLKKEVGSLDMLIAALSNELKSQRTPHSRNGSSSPLLQEMQEALCALRRERGYMRVVLATLDRQKQTQARRRAH